MTNPNIALLTTRILAKAKVTAPPVPVGEIAHSLGAIVRFGPLPDDLSGFLVHEDGNSVIGVNTRHSKPRQSFTIAHELGHFLLHPTSNFIDRKLIYFRNSRSSEATDMREIQANEFAANLLMPIRFINDATKNSTVDIEDEQLIGELAARFGVSSQALAFRLMNLHVANRPHTRRHRARTTRPR